MRGQSEVYEVINSSLVVNSVYSVMVDIDTVTGSISCNATFSKLPTANTENTGKTYENCTLLDPQFTHSKVNYTIGYKPFMIIAVVSLYVSKELGTTLQNCCYSASVLPTAVLYTATQI